MQVSSKKIDEVSIELTIKADDTDLSDIKRVVFNELRKQVKAAGFRPGKAPDNIVESSLGSQVVQSEFLNLAVSRIYTRAVVDEKLAIIGQPEVKIKTFIPYSELSFTAVTEIAPEIKLPNYKSFKVPLKPDPVTEKQVEDVLENMRRRLAEKKPVERPAKEGDELTIDFEGKDSKGEAISGASGKEFPLVLGSKTFIPGFEEELVGVKAGETKTFTVTFPKEYHAANLRGAKVTFETKILKLNEMILPAFDDEFTAKASPFKTAKELKEDVKKQLAAELNERARGAQREEVVKKLVESTKIVVPPKLLERVIGDVKSEFHRNLHMRGISEEDYYKQQDTTAEKYEKEELSKVAERRIRASLVLSEVAKAENLSVSNDELESQMKKLEENYKNDEQSKAELKRPEVREDIALQMLTERTIDKLVSYTT